MKQFTALNSMRVFRLSSSMRRFKSVRQAQRFLGAHAAVFNLFNLGRHLVSASHYRNLRISAFAEWERAVA